MARHGAGLDGIDIPAAATRGSTVTRAAGANSRAVAEHSWALLLALAKDLPSIAEGMAAGKWEGRTIGIVGYGAIGSKVARYADAFGMPVIAYDPLLPPQLLKSFGLSNTAAGLVNAIPYGFAAALMMVWGAHSDRSGERRWHTAIPLLAIAAGLACVSLASTSLPVTIALLSCTLIGHSSFEGPFWAFASGMLSPATAAAAIAGINAFSNLVGGLMVSLVGAIQDATGSYTVALLPIVVLALVSATIVLGLGRRASAEQAAIAALDR